MRTLPLLTILLTLSLPALADVAYDDTAGGGGGGDTASDEEEEDGCSKSSAALTVFLGVGLAFGLRTRRPRQDG